jgi:hypothetical protein
MLFQKQKSHELEMDIGQGLPSEICVFETAIGFYVLGENGS